MKQEAIPLDKFLQSQAQQGVRATIEPVDNQNDHVKITPFLPDHGCHCNASIKLPKSSIDSVTPTGETHYCCGKNYHVVDVKFKEGAGVAPQTVLEQLIANSAHAPAPQSFAGSSPSTGKPTLPNPGLRCETNYDNCLNRASDELSQCLCRNSYLSCIGHGGLMRQC